MSKIANDIIEELLKCAKSAQSNAYAPYSHYRVGAAVLTENGQIFSGCNVENASYPLSTCAEAGAISAMIRGGAKEIVATLVIGNGEELVSPCGGCRQRLREFASAESIVYFANENGIQDSRTVAGLLPESFGPEHLKAKKAL